MQWDRLGCSLRLPCLKWTHYKEFFRQRLFFSHQEKLIFFLYWSKCLNFSEKNCVEMAVKLLSLAQLSCNVLGISYLFNVPILCTAALSASRENGHLDICALRLCSTDRDLVHSWTWLLSKQMKGRRQGSLSWCDLSFVSNMLKGIFIFYRISTTKIRIWGFHWMAVW